MAKEGVRHVFEALDAIKGMPGYSETCSHGFYSTTNAITNEVSCLVLGVSLLYHDDYGYFLENAGSDGDVVKKLSSTTYPNGLPVDRDASMGNNRFDTDTDTIEYAESFVSFMMLPGESDVQEEVEEFEWAMIEKLLLLQREWEESGSYFRLEFYSERSFDDEFERVIIADLPLVLLVGALMTGLCVTVFHRRDRVQSRKWLGFGAMCTILLSIFASYGLLFCIGVPFTNLTPAVPFIIFGIGLDDTFIIYGSYSRMDSRLTPEDRIERTMKGEVQSCSALYCTDKRTRTCISRSFFINLSMERRRTSNHLDNADIGNRLRTRSHILRSRDQVLGNLRPHLSRHRLLLPSDIFHCVACSRRKEDPGKQVRLLLLLHEIQLFRQRGQGLQPAQAYFRPCNGLLREMAVETPRFACSGIRVSWDVRRLYVSLRSPGTF